MKDDFSLPMEFSNTVYGGFKCGTYNCNNKQAVIGTISLPFCEEMCSKRNVEHLVMENKKREGEIAILKSCLYSNGSNTFEDNMQENNNHMIA